ncbi:MAG: hypothetical protein KIS66_01905 [Fimbriimonadaceae bacterium]|nr:hypothetical protein [Fimbriimonadaceae bacterium]
MKRLPLLFALAVLAASFGCAPPETPAAKEGEKPVTTTADPKAPPMAEGSTETPEATATKIAELTKKYEDAQAAYEKSKDEATKKALVEAGVAYADYRTFKANLPPREKYAPALKVYREVLKLDPKNEGAKEAHDMIVAIYKQMGRPVPE